MATSALSFDNPLFSAYAFYSGILVLKMLFVTFCTIRARRKNKVFPSEEDFKEDLKDKPLPRNPEVDRIRRAHQNDLENIPAFLTIGLIYVLSNPSVNIALWLFRIFTAARIMHTIGYLFIQKTPARGPFFAVGTICLITMTGSVVYTGFKLGHF